MNTVNGKDPKELTKDEALAYCHEHGNKFIADCYANDDDGNEQFSCLVTILESDTIEPREIVDYGMCDQDLELVK